MKFLQILFFFTLSLQDDQNECALGVRPYPLIFHQHIATIEFKIDFKSNCLQFGTTTLFALPHDQDFNLTIDDHPQRVILSIFGKAYQFDFSDPEKLKKKKNKTLINYRQLRISPSAIPSKIFVKKENNILLRTTETNVFTKQDIDDLFYMKNPVLCELEESRKTMLCRM